MHEPRHSFRKNRQSTKDRFVSVLHGERSEEPAMPWYRMRRNYLPLFVIIMFFILALALAALQHNNYIGDEGTDETQQDAPMEYEDAKDFFGGTGE